MMKMRLKNILLLVATGLAFAACEDHDEIAFRGKVVYIQPCTMDMARPTAGYAVHLEQPDSLGATFTYNNQTYKNVVLLFDPGRIIKADDHISGTFYFDQKASRQYCTLSNLHDLEIPQGVFVEVSVD